LEGCLPDHERIEVLLRAKRGRAIRIVIATVALALSSCGQASVTITRPSHPAYIGCHGSRPSDARQLLGLSLHAAETKIPPALKGCTIRPVEIDGRHLALDGMSLSNRIAVVVQSGLIVRIEGRG
jgi:hypothetical protein